jgi:transcription elongation GreA/GreB family factor
MAPRNGLKRLDREASSLTSPSGQVSWVSPVARARIKAHEGDIVDPSIALGR